MSDCDHEECDMEPCLYAEDEDEDWNPSVLSEDERSVRLMRTRCSTCIFRPGNLMQLNKGRVKDMTDATDAEDSNVTCHQTLGTERGAICRGSYDRRPGQLAQIASRIGAIELVDAEGEEPHVHFEALGPEI